MQQILFNYRCANCNNNFKSPGLLDQSYGEFIMHTQSGYIAYLCVFDDNAMKEFETIFEIIIKNFDVQETNYRVNIFQAIFSITCDTAPDGSVYQIDLHPKCPVCGSNDMAGWLDTYPAELSDDIPIVTHTEWHKLNVAEKTIKIREAITAYISNGAL